MRAIRGKLNNFNQYINKPKPRFGGVFCCLEKIKWLASPSVR
nr:MAG TPA: hypothetical protein [Caudoviricetes sp.]